METYKGWEIKEYLGWVDATKGISSIRKDSLNEVIKEIDARENQDVFCPFCGDEGFDLIGLKHHLINGYCEEYLNTQSIERKF